MDAIIAVMIFCGGITAWCTLMMYLAVRTVANTCKLIVAPEEPKN